MQVSRLRLLLAVHGATVVGPTDNGTKPSLLPTAPNPPGTKPSLLPHCTKPSTEGDGAGGGDVPAGGGDGAAGGEGGAAAAGPVNGGSTMQRHLSFLRTYGTATDIGGKAAETATEAERGPNPSKRSRNL